MSTRSVLVHLPALPLEPEDLMPQRDLACAASALLGVGDWTRVLDYGTVSSISRYSGSTGFAARFADVAEDFRALGHLDFALFHVRTQADFAVALAFGAWLRARGTGIDLFLSGPLVTAFGGLSLVAAKAFDGAIKGDLSLALPALAACYASGGDWSRVPSLVYRQGRHVRNMPTHRAGRMGTSPPCYEYPVYPALSEEEKIHLFTIDPFPALYVASSNGGDGGWHARQLGAEGPGRIREEMDSVVKCFGGGAFHLTGASHGDTMQERVARELLDHGRCYPYSVVGKPDAAAHQVYPLLRASGCLAVHYEVLTGSQRLQDDFYRSGYGISLVEEHFRACHQAGLHGHAGLTYPCPHDDYHTLAETLRLLRRCRPGSISIGLPALAEGSIWWRDPAPFGFRISPRATLRWLRAPGFAAGRKGTHALPYGMRGWPPQRIIAAREQLGCAIAGLCLSWGGTVNTAMMARLSGYQGDEGAYASVLSNLLALGDASALRGVVREFNASVTHSSSETGYAAFRPALEAVGN